MTEGNTLGQLVTSLVVLVPKPIIAGSGAGLTGTVVVGMATIGAASLLHGALVGSYGFFYKVVSTQEQNVVSALIAIQFSRIQLQTADETKYNRTFRWLKRGTFLSFASALGRFFLKGPFKIELTPVLGTNSIIPSIFFCTTGNSGAPSRRAYCDKKVIELVLN